MLYTGRDWRCDAYMVSFDLFLGKGLTEKKNFVLLRESIDSYEDVPVNKKNELKKAVASQWVRVVIEAGGRDFQLYESYIQWEAWLRLGPQCEGDEIHSCQPACMYGKISSPSGKFKIQTVQRVHPLHKEETICWLMVS